MSYTQQLIKSYKHKQQKELLLTIGYHFLEALTLVGIIAFGIMIMTLR